ncbi:MAG: leucine-rich repeat domain-containing protein [Candidatus Sigynarchaeota archaeon]
MGNRPGGSCRTRTGWRCWYTWDRDDGATGLNACSFLSFLDVFDEVMDTRASTDDGHLDGLADEEKSVINEIERKGESHRLPIHAPFKFQRQDLGWLLTTPVDALHRTYAARDGHVVELSFGAAWWPEFAPLLNALPFLEVLEFRDPIDEVIDFSFVRDLPRLKVLVLDRGKVAQGLPGIEAAAGLEVLRARECGLRAFPEAVTRLPSLRVLDLSDNPIGAEPPPAPPEAPEKPWFLKRENKWVDGTLRDEYRTTEAQRCAEHEAYRRAMEAWKAARAAWVPPPPKVHTALPDSVCNLRRLEELRVARCGLTGLPDCIGDLRGLRVLDVSGNPLGSLPASMARLENLEELHAGGCGLSALPDLSHVPLRHVDVNGNRFTKLPDWLETWAFDNTCRTYNFGYNPLAEPLRFIEPRREKYQPPPPADDDDDDFW